LPPDNLEIYWISSTYAKNKSHLSHKNQSKQGTAGGTHEPTCDLGMVYRTIGIWEVDVGRAVGGTVAQPWLQDILAGW